MTKRKRGFKFTVCNLKSLVKAVEELVPISNTQLEQVWDRHMALYPQQDRTLESLKCKFQEMARAKIKTCNPNILCSFVISMFCIQCNFFSVTSEVCVGPQN
jgi:hypothetical protein